MSLDSFQWKLHEQKIIKVWLEIKCTNIYMILQKKSKCNVSPYKIWRENPLNADSRSTNWCAIKHLSISYETSPATSRMAYKSSNPSKLLTKMDASSYTKFKK